MQSEKWKLSLLLQFLVAVPLLCAAQEPATSVKNDRDVMVDESTEGAITPVLETVVVTGTLPGPSLWRVRNGENDLYILGSHSPLPAGMEWDSLEVEEILATAQEVLAPSGAEAKLSAGDMFKISLLARSANAATKIPSRQTLEDLLPPSTFSEWEVLRAKYLPNDRGVDRQRPIFASQELYYRAIEASGMTRGGVVWNRIAAIAENRGIAIKQTKIEFPLEIDRKKYKAGIAAITESQVDETTCFAQTVNSLEADLELMRKGANAWATGDLDLIRTLSLIDPQPACKKVYDQLMGFQHRPELDALADDAWVAAAKDSLSKNNTTFAVLPLQKLMGPSSLVERLRSAGYRIEAPDDEFDLDEVDSPLQRSDDS